MILYTLFIRSGLFFFTKRNYSYLFCLHEYTYMFTCAPTFSLRLDFAIQA